MYYAVAFVLGQASMLGVLALAYKHSPKRLTMHFLLFIVALVIICAAVGK